MLFGETAGVYCEGHMQSTDTITRNNSWCGYYWVVGGYVCLLFNQQQQTLQVWRKYKHNFRP